MSGEVRLDGLLEVLADAIIEARAQNMIARDAGLSEKHVSQMLTGKVDGSLGAWQRMLDAAGLGLRVEVVDLRAALAPKPAPEADPRCEATFPCHPTPEWPCDDPEMDHRCALPARHGRSGEDEGHRLTVHLMRPDGTMPTCRLNKGGGNFTARPEDATCPACAPQPAPGEIGGAS